MSASSSASSVSAAATSSRESMLSMSDSRTASETSTRISPSRSALTRSQTTSRSSSGSASRIVGDVGRMQRGRAARAARPRSARPCSQQLLHLAQVLLQVLDFEPRFALGHEPWFRGSAPRPCARGWSSRGPRCTASRGRARSAAGSAGSRRATPPAPALSADAGTPKWWRAAASAPNTPSPHSATLR